MAAIVQRRAALAGLTGDFGAHSLRSGFVTEGERRGIALPAIMALIDHRAFASVVGYHQAGRITDNPASQLLPASPSGTVSFGDMGLASSLCPLFAQRLSPGRRTSAPLGSRPSNFAAAPSPSSGNQTWVEIV